LCGVEMEVCLLMRATMRRRLGFLQCTKAESVLRAVRFFYDWPIDGAAYCIYVSVMAQRPAAPPATPPEEMHR
jgi:hypothetical protein